MPDAAQPSTSETQAPPPSQGDGAAADASPPLDPGGEMSFLDHLEELRWSLFKAIGGVFAGVVVVAFFSEWVINEVLMGPTRTDFFMYRALAIDAEELILQNRTMTGQFFAHIGTIVAVGLVAGSPIFVYYLWSFVEPALYPHEKAGLRFASAFATFFFILGIAFGYLILTPLALQFFANYQIDPNIINEFDIMRYFSMITFWALGTGILFELPVAIYFLAKLGVVTPVILRTYRKYALLIILVLGAIFTPPDPISQIIVAVPLVLLYELSILIAAYSDRRRKKKLAKLEKEGKKVGG